MKTFIVLFIIFCFSSCEKKELPAPSYDRGNVSTAQIELSSNYKNQVWFSLSDDKVVSTNYKTDWDLCFESSATGDHIMLNGSKAMKVYRTNFSSLSQVTDTIGLGAGSVADMPSGNLDSTAVGEWQTSGKVYIVNKGYSESGQFLGIIKLKINSVSSTQYVFEYSDISGTQVFQKSVVKDPDYNFVYFSFSSNHQIAIEPKKASYDLCFTQYTHLFINPLQYYQVTGVLNNTFNTRIVKLHRINFNDVTISDTLAKNFETARNVVGYDWKTFNFSTNLYTVDPQQVFIINDSKGFYYKLHFIDFYNSQGLKGYPTFEFKKL